MLTKEEKLEKLKRIERELYEILWESKGDSEHLRAHLCEGIEGVHLAEIRLRLNF